MQMKGTIWRDHKAGKHRGKGLQEAGGNVVVLTDDGRIYATAMREMRRQSGRQGRVENKEASTMPEGASK
jgi:hypothetical protein